jgi:hypothetical protein
MIDFARVATGTTGFGEFTRGGAIQREMLYLDEARAFASELLPDQHAARVESLANGVAGVMRAGKAAIHAIGAAYASLKGIKTKSGIKQIDRLLSNEKLDLDDVFVAWVAFVVSAREEMVVALDWTEFDKDDHATLCAYTATSHGRATPLVWRTVKKSTLRGKRTETEHEVIEMLHRWVDPKVRITLLADRGFGDRKLYELLQLYGWDFVVRFRGGILVDHQGTKKPAKDWIPSSGRAAMLTDVRITDDGAALPAVVVVHDKKMKDGWCLATTLASKKAPDVVALYGKRFSIEESFRDAKDLHFGLGLSATHIRDAVRRDRLMLLLAMAIALLTLLGAAAEKTGLDRMLKANTVAKRSHSLFRQGLMLWDRIPREDEGRLRMLIQAFDEIVREHAVFRTALGIL